MKFELIILAHNVNKYVEMHFTFLHNKVKLITCLSQKKIIMFPVSLSIGCLHLLHANFVFYNEWETNT